MRRVIAAVLLAAMLVSATNLSVFAETSSKAATQAVGNLTAAIRLDYPELLNNVEQRNFKLQLKEGQQVHAEIFLSKEPSTKTFPVDGKEVTVLVSLHNEHDVDLTAENTVGYYEVEFKGLPNNKNYTVALSAEGYTDYESQEILLKDYSRKILIGSWEGGFSLGDVTNDGKINEQDLNQVTAQLGQNSSDADITKDNQVDIEDLAIIHHNQGEKGQAVLFETTAIVGTIVDQQETKNELESQGINVEGNLSDLFEENGESVKLEASSSGEIVLPISFTEPVEMEQITIQSPPGNGAVQTGEVEVTYEENGQEKTETVSFDASAPEGVHAISRDKTSSSVVINLGKRVAVKKVTIKVEKVEGDTGYTVVENIQFLKDIVPDNVEITNSIPTNLKATAGAEQVELSWKAVNNVDGYLVKYGTSSGNYTRELKVSVPEATIEGLENLTKYYFAVAAYTEDGWTGKLSSEVTATPQPNKVPSAPDYLKVAPQDQALSISWGKTDDALSYRVYYKKSSDPDTAYTKVDTEITATSYALGGLENDVSYDVYVTAVNNIGEGPRSLVASGTPEKIEVKGPELPELGRISNDKITSIQMAFPANVDTTQYPNGFNLKFVADNDYATHWTARRWWESKEFIFEFDEEQSMNYLIYVPRVDGQYARSLNRYTITAWDKDGNKTYLTSDKGNVGSGPYVKNNPSETKYAILPFERNDHIKKISVEVNQWDGSPTNISLSEIAFYEYNGVEDQIDALFANESKTKLAEGVDEQTINQLREQLNATQDFYIDSDILKDELNLAEQLLQNNTSALGIVMDGIQSRDTTGDVRVLNTLQPIGAVANSGKKIVVYAEIPEGESVTLVPTQFYAESNSWKGTPIALQNGRNVITMPTMTSLSAEKGGSLYLQYSGSNADRIKLQIRGNVTKIPMLELSDWESMSEQQRKEKITNYVEELNTYVAALGSNNLQTNIRNATEISLPYVLLSLPADQVQSGISGGASSTEAKVERLYQNTLAWNQLMELMYRTHGVDDITTEASRNNIRYQRMFSGAFMYAAGEHIGVEYGSTAPLVQGIPAGSAGFGEESLFGWGIAHEIGHNMDTLGHAEITNNIYSLFAQTFDAGQNAKASRLELSDLYPNIFDKTSSGAKGLANNVFVQLGMYWQLHLAYDDADDNFYNLVNKAYRSGVGSGFSGDERFAVVASEVAGYDLTEFFTQWGVQLSDAAISAMRGHSTESRKIHYLSDESRRQRMNNSGSASGSVSMQASVNEKEVVINITPSLSGSVQGYEILKNDKPYAFVTEGSDLTFTDTIGSANNKTFTYQVKAIDLLGNVAAESTKEEVLISHNNVISRDLWNAQRQEDGTMLINFTQPQTVAGILFKDMPELVIGESDPVIEDSQQPEQDIPAEEETEKDSSGESNEEKAENVDSNVDSVENAASFFADLFAGEEADTTLETSTDEWTENSEDAGLTEEQPQLPEDNNGNENGSVTEGDQSEEEPSEDEKLPAEDETEETLPDETLPDETHPEENLPEENLPEENLPEEDKPETVPSNQIVVQVSKNGVDFTTVLTIDLKQTDLTKSENLLQLFNSGADDGRITICEDTKAIRILGLPKNVTEANFDFVGYPGDSIAFMDGAIGRLAHDYQYGEDSSEVIPAGTLIVAGTYRGDPVYNTIQILGEYLVGDMAQGSTQTEERPINGEVYLFAEVLEEGALAEINNGIWIFVPNIQAEEEFQGEGCAHSILPSRIKAVLYRTDDPNNAQDKRKVSDTRWISSPSDESMPQITLQGE